DTGKICRQVVRPLEESREAAGPPFLA
ncbi:hypothetical protein RBB72_29780, partial [Pseudomonas aeruginosa]|nr:hypothetical protein [Pseudomonas aeruginosa]